MRTHRLPRPVLVLLLGVLLGGALAGCSDEEQASWSGPAATVNGAEISRDAVIEASKDSQGLPEDSDPKSLATSDLASELQTLITIEVARQEAARQGVEISDDDRQVALQAQYESMGTDPTTGQVDVAAGQQAFEQQSQATQEFQIETAALLEALARNISDEEAGVEPVTDEAVSAAYEDAVDDYTKRCSSVVAIDPSTGDQAAQEARAEEIMDGLRAGDDVQQYIEEETTDPNQPAGGSLGCSSASELQSQVSQGLPQEVADGIFEVDPGDPFGPVVTGGAVYVVLVEEEQVTSQADAEAQIRADLESQNDESRKDLVRKRIGELMVDADVWVDPTFGEWVLFDDAGAVTTDARKASSAGVTPPEGPEPPPVDTDTTAVAPGQPTGSLVPGS